MASTAQKKPVTPDSASWINGLSSIVHLSDRRLDPNLKTIISSDVKNGKLALFVPPEMSEFQPENLRYLHALASRNGFMLIEDRRDTEICPLVEQRDLKPNKLAIGLSELLKQAGVPGPNAQLSRPHRLTPTNPHFDITMLIDMVAATVHKSKRVVILPTPAMVETTGNETHPISGYACKLVTADTDMVLCYFDSPGFKAIGYLANGQFVVHVLIGGGQLKSPHIWANFDAMSKNRFRLQLFRCAQLGQDFGLLYNTFYLDIETEKADSTTSPHHGRAAH